MSQLNPATVSAFPALPEEYRQIEDQLDAIGQRWRLVQNRPRHGALVRIGAVDSIVAAG